MFVPSPPQVTAWHTTGVLQRTARQIEATRQACQCLVFDTRDGEMLPDLQNVKRGNAVMSIVTMQRTEAEH